MKKSNFIRVYLDKNCKKDAYCERNEYFTKYGEFDKNGYFKKMMVGAPKIINIQGTYYYIDKLKAIFSSRQLLDRYISELNTPQMSMKRLIFIWR